MGLTGAAFGLGIVLGPLLGGVLSGHAASFTVPCMVAGGMSMLAILVAALFLPESLPPAPMYSRAHNGVVSSRPVLDSCGQAYNS